MIRVKPAKLVEMSVPKNGNKSWFDELNIADHLYVSCVIKYMRKTPNASLHVVARNLKNELKIQRSVSTVARTLKEFLNAAS